MILSRRSGVQRDAARRHLRLGSAAAVLAALCVLPACSTASTDAAGRERTLSVVVSFYPLEFVVQRVGGAYVEVSNLTPAGAEPHDLEIGAKDLVRMRRADLVVYLADVAPAVDDAVSVAARQHSLDVTANVSLIGDDNVDRHFWLDPLRLADAADAVARQLSSLRPELAAAFTSNANALRRDLEQLDDEFRTGIASATCESRDLVTAHEAFGYLASRYGLRQVGVSGLQPDAEPTASDLAAVADFVRSNGVRTIYAETLASPEVSKVLATATGAEWMVLDPLEGLDEGSSGSYLSVMRSNLQTLREGQGCA